MKEFTLKQMSEKTFTSPHTSIQGCSDLKTYLLMRWWGPDALAICRAHRGLPVGFIVLRCSVLFTVESLSLLYLLFIS